MPYSGRLAWSAYQDFHAARERLELAKQERAEQDRRVEKAREFRKFSEEAQGFAKVMRENRLEEQNWTTYEVEIKQRLVNVTELRTILSNAAPTPRYYFRPKQLEVTSLLARDHLPEDYRQLLHDKKLDKLMIAKLLKKLELDTTPTPGEKVLLSLSGTYMVLNRN
ncbi:MAG: hypothetical protein HQL96_11165 [Magnetococcales bacterium]|nr:hypothetical protein [Magnetococcales bacterium]